ncbi:MAG: 50S ribosomal protein L11 methyltransferase [Gammaproteobacteria bacterium]
MAWWQLSFVCAEEQVSFLSRLLDDLGAVAVGWCPASDEALCEDSGGAGSLWKRTRLRGLFPCTADVAKVVMAMEAALAPDRLPSYDVETLQDRDWAAFSRSHFQPLRIGERLWIGASWHQPPSADTVNVVLDPGRAFGTGAHVTTALCLEWLEGTDLAGAEVIDYGCGSGILAIAAVKLGARHVFAVDSDANALVVTQENALRNGVAQALTVGLPETLPQVRAHGILANILAVPLIGLAPQFAALVRTGGWVVLSGILEAQVDAVAAAYRPWFHMHECVLREGWARVIGQRVSPGD